ncbi:hypothetical protein C8Q80DRAFT_158812 [Daedaleopsis nitida]|nr:hypothetical protein C8Q80DRAFT_158812 [Daedaleopsis nitida]
MSHSFKLLSLPIELRHTIKDFIAPFDLRTHVCFYLSHPDCAALYGSKHQEDDFWKFICWHNGLGKLPDDEYTLISDWREVAMDCIRADGFCTHPECGESILEYNRRRMQKAAKYVEPFKPYPVDENTDWKVNCHPHYIFGHIGFLDSEEVQGCPPVELDAHLRLAATPEPAAANDTDKDSHEGYHLEDHPLVARSFATLTPVSSLSLINVCGLGSSSQAIDRSLTLTRVVTVLDVLQILQNGLDVPLDRTDIDEYLDYHDHCIEEKKLSPEELSDTLSCTRDILSICPIEHLEHEANLHTGPALAFDQY